MVECGQARGPSWERRGRRASWRRCPPALQSRPATGTGAVWRALPGSRLGVRPPGEVLPVHRDVGRPGAAASLAGLWFLPLTLSQGGLRTAEGTLCSKPPRPTFLLLPGGPTGPEPGRLLWPPLSPAVLGRGRGGLQGDALVTLASRTSPPSQAGGPLPPPRPSHWYAPSSCSGPLPGIPGCGCPAHRQDAARESRNRRMWGNRVLPWAGPPARVLPSRCPTRWPLHVRAGASFRLGLGPAQKCSWGWLARLFSPAFGLQWPQQTPVPVPWSRRGPACCPALSSSPSVWGALGPRRLPFSLCQLHSRTGPGWSC